MGASQAKERETETLLSAQRQKPLGGEGFKVDDDFDQALLGTNRIDELRVVGGYGPQEIVYSGWWIRTPENSL